jgi:hypothetical protein
VECSKELDWTNNQHFDTKTESRGRSGRPRV